MTDTITHPAELGAVLDSAVASAAALVAHHQANVEQAELEHTAATERLAEATAALEVHRALRDRCLTTLAAWQAAEIAGEGDVPASDPSPAPTAAGGEAAAASTAKSAEPPEPQPAKPPRAVTPPAALPTTPRPPTPTWEQVARCYLEAKAAGKPAAQALADTYDVPLSTAKNWPGSARRHGYLNADLTGPGEQLAGVDNPPAAAPEPVEEPAEANADSPRISAPPPTNHDQAQPRNVYACETKGCGFTAPDSSTGRADMRRHCDREHDRRPSTLELTPGVAD